MNNYSDKISKEPPHAIEAEKNILGAILLDSDSIMKSIELIKPHMFFDMRHQIIYSTMEELFAANIPIDTVSLYEKLKSAGKIEDAGGLTYLAKLSQDISSSANISYHCVVVKEKYMTRQVIKDSIEIAGLAYEGQTDIFELLSMAQSKLFDLTANSFKRSGEEFSAIGKKVIMQLESVKQGDISQFAVPTGYADLDKEMIGMFKGDLIIIAGRPGSSKTSLMLSIAKNISKENWVGIFSLEMSSGSLYTRVLSGETGISFRQFITAGYSQGEGANISRAIHNLQNLKIYVDDTPAITILELQAKAKLIKHQYGIKALFVDYLQLMKAGKNLPREQEISTISQSLKALAKDLNIPVIALAQLNRSLEARTDKVPQLSDLRESGAIEQDADVVLMMYRPEMYGIRNVESSSGSQIETENLAQIIIAKQRNLSTGKVDLIFNKKLMKFENYTAQNKYYPEINRGID